MGGDVLSVGDVARMLGVSVEQAQRTVVVGALASPDGTVILHIGETGAER